MEIGAGLLAAACAVDACRRRTRGTVECHRRLVAELTRSLGTGLWMDADRSWARQRWQVYFDDIGDAIDRRVAAGGIVGHVARLKLPRLDSSFYAAWSCSFAETYFRDTNTYYNNTFPASSTNVLCASEAELPRALEDLAQHGVPNVRSSVAFAAQFSTVSKYQACGSTRAGEGK